MVLYNPDLINHFLNILEQYYEIIYTYFYQDGAKTKSVKGYAYMYKEYEFERDELIELDFIKKL